MHSTAFLDGIRIVTMAQNVPGPLAAARLQQAGARVTKVEPPAGDPFLAVSPAWHAEMHAGTSIERLDLKVESGQARMMALLLPTGAPTPLVQVDRRYEIWVAGITWTDDLAR